MDWRPSVLCQTPHIAPPCLFGASSRICATQFFRSIPSLAYHAIMPRFYEGDYVIAKNAFQQESRLAIKTPQSLWIDSICYQTMVGECYYRTGDLDEALQCYTAAVQLYLSFPNWMQSVQFPDSIRLSNTGRGTPWGTSTRTSQLGQYPAVMSIFQGKLDNTPALVQGGVVQMPQLVPIEVQEIVRCTILAIRRRGELLGPLAKYDKINNDLIAALAQRPGKANHWSQAWIDVELACALINAGRFEEAVPVLNRSQVAAGQFDHPFTCTALLQMGRLDLVAGNYPRAVTEFLEASYSAYQYGDPGVLEEAVQAAAVAHLASNAKGVFPPLAVVAQWAKTKELRSLRVSALVSLAENCTVFEAIQEAAAALNEAQVTIGRTAIAISRLGARLNFVRALTLVQQRKIDLGDASVSAAMDYMRRGSFWVFQIAHADAELWADRITPRTAMDLFGLLLRNPQPADWTIDPMESLAVLVTPHSAVYEHWFLVALKRNDHDAALEISDRARRHRFFSTLAYGGRLEGLRWILEAPDDALDQAALLQRQDLLAQHPAYGKLSRQARQIREQILKMPLVATDQETARKQSQRFAELAAVSANQDAIIREMALRREAAALVFPPLRSTKDIQKAIPKGTAMLAFFNAGGEYYAFLLNQDKYAAWTIKNPRLAAQRLQGLLREMGHYDANHELGPNDLGSTQWKQAAKQLLDDLVAGSNADLSKKFPELVIVPDGFLWYVPFEALQVNVANQQVPLLSRFRIRYAPTLSLAVPDKRSRTQPDDTAVVLGRLYPRDADSVTQTGFEDLAKVLPGSSALGKGPLPAPSSLYKLRMGRLIVLDDLALFDANSVYSWAPIQLERNKAGSTLSDWLSLPWGGPETIVLPGFHTVAESAFKRTIRSPGSEVFLSVCAMLSTGARTLLISRWRTGGQSSLDLVREFAQELPHTSPSDAWQRAVLLLMEGRLNAAAEPRIKRTVGEQPIRGDHPFFWSGYMLVDSGSTGNAEGDDELEPGGAPAKPAAQPPAAKPADGPPPKEVDAPAKGKPGKRRAKNAANGD